jgi:hypothetical protein
MAYDVDRTLRYVTVGSLVILAALHVGFIYHFNSRLSVKPKEVLMELEDRLAVTPAMVLEKLEQIERDHQLMFKQALEREKARLSEAK